MIWVALKGEFKEMSIGIYVVAIVMWAVLGMWTWHSEKKFEDNKIKIIYMLLCVLILGVVTLIIFNISKNNISYPNSKMISPVRKMILMLFIPINGFIVVPYITLQLGDFKIGDIKEDVLKKRILKILIIFLVILIFECSYLKSIQNGIINIYVKGGNMLE